MFQCLENSIAVLINSHKGFTWVQWNVLFWGNVMKPQARSQTKPFFQICLTFWSPQNGHTACVFVAEGRIYQLSLEDNWSEHWGFEVDIEGALGNVSSPSFSKVSTFPQQSEGPQEDNLKFLLPLDIWPLHMTDQLTYSIWVILTTDCSTELGPGGNDRRNPGTNILPEKGEGRSSGKPVSPLPVQLVELPRLLSPKMVLGCWGLWN